MANFTASTDLTPYTTDLGSISYYDKGLSKLLKEQNSFVYDATTNKIMNGSFSYNVNNGDSHYWIKFTTTAATTLYIDCSVSSEGNYDFGHIHVSKQQLIPGRNAGTVADGSVLFNASGISSGRYAYNLLANTTYYVNFNYQKDGSKNSNSDRFFVERFQIGNPKFDTNTDITQYVTDLGTITTYTGGVALLLKPQGSWLYDAANDRIMSGPSSYNINAGISHYWIKFTTTIDSVLLVTCDVSSESRYDFGSVSISTTQQKPARAASTVTDGTIICSISGTVGSTYTYPLAANTTYYVNLNYQKDQSQNAGSDRFFVSDFQIIPRRFNILKAGVTTPVFTGLSGSFKTVEGVMLKTTTTETDISLLNSGSKIYLTTPEISPELSLSSTSSTVTYSETTTFTASRTGGGALSVSTDNAAVATATINTSTGVVTVTSVRSGTANIIVKCAATTGYHEDSKGYQITVNKAVNNLALSSSSLLVATGTSQNVTITNPSGGTLSVTPTNDSNDYVNATISGTTLTITGKSATTTGQTITVTSAETDRYQSATATMTCTTGKLTNTLSLSATSGSVNYNGTTTFTVKTNTSGGALSVSPTSGNTYVKASISGSTVTITGLQATTTAQTITVTSAATDSYDSATATYSVTVNKINNTLTLSATSGSVNYNSTATFTVSTNTSGGTLSVTPTNNSNTYINATISGTTVTITGRQATTTAQTITVSSAATTNYNAATATYSVTVNKINGSVTLSATSGSVNWNGTSTFTVTGNTSGGALSVTPTSGNSYANASISDTTVTITGVAYTATAQTITVTSAATTNYNAATATYKVTVNRTSPGLTISKTSGTIAYPATDSFTWSRAGSGTVTASSNQTGIATTSNPNSTAASGTITVTSVKPSSTKATITVSVAASGNYSAESKTYVATINKGTNTLTLSATSGTINWNGTGSFTITTNASGGTLSVAPTNNSNSYVNATISGTTVSLTGRAYASSAQTITVTSAATDYYDSATKTYSCTIARTASSFNLSATSVNCDWNSTATVTVSDIVGTGAISVSSNATGYATVAYNSSTKVVTVTGKAYRSTAVTITVSIAANGNYNAASKTFTVYVKQTAPGLTLSKSSSTITYPTTSDTFNVTKAGAGKITISSGNTDIVTVSPSSTTATSTTVTLTGVKPNNSTPVTITLSCAASGNYAAESKTFTFTYKKGETSFIGVTTAVYDSNGAGGGLVWSPGDDLYVGEVIQGYLSLDHLDHFSSVTADSDESVHIDIGTPTAVNSDGFVGYPITITPLKSTKINSQIYGLIDRGVVATGDEYYNNAIFGLFSSVKEGSPQLSLSSTSGSVAWNGTTTFTATTLAGTSNLSVSSNATSYATVSVNTSTGVVTITGKSYRSSAVTITVTSKATSDYTSQTATFSCTVTKTTPTLTLSATSVNCNWDSTATVTVTSNPSGGTISASSNATAYATVSTSGSTITVTGVKYRSSAVTITVTSAATGNYNAAKKTFTVYVKQTTPTLSLSDNMFLHDGEIEWSACDDCAETVEVSDEYRESYGIFTNSSGALSVSSSASSTATASIGDYDDGEYTFKQLLIKGVKGGTATLTVKVAASGNYTSNTASVSVTVYQPSAVTASVNKVSVNVDEAVTYTINNPNNEEISVAFGAPDITSIEGYRNAPNGIEIEQEHIDNAKLVYINMSFWTNSNGPSNFYSVRKGNSYDPSVMVYEPTISTDTRTVSSSNAGAMMFVINVSNGTYSLGKKIVFFITVNRITPTLSFSKTSLSTPWNSNTTFTVTNSGNGALSVAPTNNSNSYVNTTISGNTVTVTGRAYSASAQTITVTSAETNKYNSATKTISATITRTSPTITLNPTSISVEEGSSATFTVARDGSGTISISSNTSTATATTSISGTTVTVNGVKAGTCTLTVAVAASGNYSSATKTISVTVTEPALKLSWADIQSYTKAGTLGNYMSIGDAIIVTPTGYPSGLSESDYTQLEAVLMAINHNPTYEGAKNSQWYLRNKAQSASSILVDDVYGTTEPLKGGSYIETEYTT